MVAIYCLSNTCSVVIDEIIYGIDNYVKYYLTVDNKIRKAKIKQTKSGRSYFMCKDMRIYLDECMKI